MVTTDEELIKRGFKKFNTTGHLGEAKKYLFQKRYMNDEGDTLYFLDIYKYDWSIFPVNRVPDQYTFSITTQLYKVGDHDAINIEFGSYITIEEAEEFIDKLFKMKMVEPYELAEKQGDKLKWLKEVWLCYVWGFWQEQLLEYLFSEYMHY